MSLDFSIEEVSDKLSNTMYVKYGVELSSCYASCATELILEIKKLPVSKGKSFYLLADQVFGDCCVDFLSARTLSLECILHFGDSCFTKYDDPIPLMYFLPRKVVDIEQLSKRVLEACDPNKWNVIIPECGILHLQEQLKEKIKNDKVVFPIKDATYNKTIMGRNYMIEGVVENMVLIYIGENDKMLEPLIWTYGAKNAVILIYTFRLFV